MNHITPQESAERWKVLLNSHVPSIHKHDSEKDGDDPFDCSDIVIPPTLDLVEQVVAQHEQKWRDLETRRIPKEEVLSSSAPNKEGHAPSKKRQKMGGRGSIPNWGWHANRVRLPDGFDYASRRSRPPNDDEVQSDDDRVLSLTNPSQTLSYHAELWKLFQEVPTVEQLEQEVWGDNEQNVQNSNQTGEEVETAEATPPGCMHMIALVDEMKRVGKPSEINGDMHSLSRFRMREWHGACPKQSHLTPHGGSDNNNMYPIIRVECWQQQLKRGPSPDSAKMELELSGHNHTLWDLHRAIVELAEDEILRMEETSTVKGESDSSRVNGIFFIEDTFYTVGNVDYTKPILDWLDGKDQPDTESVTTESDKNPNCIGTNRRKYLGITEKEINVKSMKAIRLDQLSFRLGTRYFHVHNGNVECSVYFTDVSICSSETFSFDTGTKQQRVNGKNDDIVILHDIWTPNHPLIDCEACKTFAAVLLTHWSPLTHGGPTALCQTCFDNLHSANKNKETDTTDASDKVGGTCAPSFDVHVQSFRSWRDHRPTKGGCG